MNQNDSAKTYDLLIVGGGPAGIEAALQATRHNLDYLLIEKKYVGSLILDTMAEKKFYHEYGRNTAKLKGVLTFPDRILGGELVRLWQAQSQETGLRIVQDAVRSIAKEDTLFNVSTVAGTYRAKNVLLTSGTFENPRKLHIPGEEGNPKVAYALDYYNDYDDQQIIVAGGGNSAVESVLEYCPLNHVTLLVRKDRLKESVTERNRKDLESAVANGQVSLRLQTEMCEIKGETATIENAGTKEELPYNHIFIHVGYEQPLEFLKSCGIKVEESLGGVKPVFDDKFETNIQGLFLAGSLTGADSVIESANQSYAILQHVAKEFS